jgi:hypothetical protein
MTGRSTWKLLTAFALSLLLLGYAWTLGEASESTEACLRDWICAGDEMQNFCNPDPDWGCDNGPFCLSWCCTCAGPGV